MARKHRHPEHANHERWLISYADFITLLFAFFVVMFASSQTDKSKARQISAAVKDALETGGVPAVVHEILGGTVDDKGKGNAQMKGPGGSQKIQAKVDVPESRATVTDLLPSMRYLTDTLAQEIRNGKLEVHLDGRGLVVSLKQAAFFPSGGDEIAGDSLGILETIANTIRDVPNSVRLEGHTDAIPIHNERFRSNWELSAARSIAMLELFATRFGVPRDRFSVAGFAETKPIADNATNDGRAKNRRVDIIILNEPVIVKEGQAVPTPSVTAQERPPASSAATSGTADKRRL